MITCILTIGTVNLLLGFFLAVKFDHVGRTGRHRVDAEGDQSDASLTTKVDSSAAKPAETVPDVVEGFAQTELEPSGDPLLTIPPEWVAILDEQEILANTFVEATVHVLRLQVDRYREELVHLGEYLFSDALDDPKFAVTLNKQFELHRDWIEQQKTAQLHLTQRRKDLREHYELGERLEQILLRQSERTKVAVDHLKTLETSSVSDHLDSVKESTRELIHLAHQLRDSIQQSLVVILRTEDRLDSFDRKVQFDSLTGFQNLHGLDVLFRDWWRDDPSRQKPLSLGLIDLDDFAAVNTRFGSRVGDDVLVKFGELVTELNEKGTAVARFSGSAFFYFFSDCGPQNATAEIEQVRQTLNVTIFQVGDQTIELTASCGVVDVLPEDDLDGVYKSATKAVAAARRGDGNRTYTAVGDDLSPTSPPVFRVRERSFVVRA